jgi:hypothetical protein
MPAPPMHSLPTRLPFLSSPTFNASFNQALATYHKFQRNDSSVTRKQGATSSASPSHFTTTPTPTPTTTTVAATPTSSACASADTSVVFPSHSAFQQLKSTIEATVTRMQRDTTDADAAGSGAKSWTVRVPTSFVILRAYFQDCVLCDGACVC